MVVVKVFVTPVITYYNRTMKTDVPLLWPKTITDFLVHFICKQ